MSNNSPEASELDKDPLEKARLKRQYPDATDAELEIFYKQQKASKKTALQHSPPTLRSAQSKQPFLRLEQVAKKTVVVESPDDSDSKLQVNSESGTKTNTSLVVDDIHLKDNTSTPKTPSSTTPSPRFRKLLSQKQVRDAFQKLAILESTNPDESSTERSSIREEDFGSFLYKYKPTALLLEDFQPSATYPPTQGIPVIPDLPKNQPTYPPKMDNTIYKEKIARIELEIPIILYFIPTPPAENDTYEGRALVSAIHEYTSTAQTNTGLEQAITQALQKIESLAENINDLSNAIQPNLKDIFHLLHSILKQVLWECTLTGTLYNQCNATVSAENNDIRNRIRAKRDTSYKESTPKVIIAQNMLSADGYTQACFEKTILVTPTRSQVKQLKELLPDGEQGDFDNQPLVAPPGAAAAPLPPTNNPIGTPDLTATLVHMANLQSHAGLNTRPPKFKGDVEKYPDWFSTFTAMVDQNPNCNDSLKLLRLKESLQGEVQLKAEKYYFSDDAYTRILAMIKEEYGDPEIIADALKQKIILHEQVSVYTTEKLRGLADKVDYYYAYCKTNLPDEIINAKALVKDLYHKLSPQFKDKYLQHKGKLRVTIDEKTYAKNELNHFRIWLLEISEERKRADKAYVVNPSQTKTTMAVQYSPPKKENQKTQRSTTFFPKKQNVPTFQQRQKPPNQPQKKFWQRKQTNSNKAPQPKTNIQPVQRQPQSSDDKKLKNSFQSFLTNIGLDKKTALYTDAKSNTNPKPRIDVERIKRGARNPQCILCLGGHSTTTCNKDLNPAQVLYRIWTNNACANCFFHGHNVPQCKEANNCKKCNKRHATKVHIAIMDLAAATAEPNGNGKKTNNK